MATSLNLLQSMSHRPQPPPRQSSGSHRPIHDARIQALNDFHAAQPGRRKNLSLGSATSHAAGDIDHRPKPELCDDDSDEIRGDHPFGLRAHFPTLVIDRPPKVPDMGTHTHTHTSCVALKALHPVPRPARPLDSSSPSPYTVLAATADGKSRLQAHNTRPLRANTIAAFKRPWRCLE